MAAGKGILLSAGRRKRKYRVCISTKKNGAFLAFRLKIELSWEISITFFSSQHTHTHTRKRVFVLFVLMRAAEPQ